MNLETLVLKVPVTGDFFLKQSNQFDAWIPVGSYVQIRVPLGGPRTPSPENLISPELQTKVFLTRNILDKSPVLKR